MPNIVTHYIVGEKVLEELNVNREEFQKGNLYPDYIDKKYHFRKQGKHFLIPDIELAKCSDIYPNPAYKLGFLSHLILDKIFLEEYVINHIYDKTSMDINIFTSNGIYKDYTNISPYLLEYFGYSLKDIIYIMKLDKKIYYDTFLSLVNDISKVRDYKLKYLDKESFTEFINEVPERVLFELKEHKRLIN